MADYMREASMSEGELSVEERNPLSVAYKNAVGSRRASWRIISSVEQKETTKSNTEAASRAAQYRLKVEKELDDICAKILSLLENHLITKDETTEHESQVFYYKMKGDYHRYIAEYKSDDDKSKASNAAKDAYKTAMDIAET